MSQEQLPPQLLPESEVEVKYSRFKDAPWFLPEGARVLIGGAGGIGSWLTLFLSRAGFKPVVFDHDLLEEVNMAGQFFTKSSINQFKVDALSALIQDFCGDDMMVAKQTKITRDTMTHKYCFSAFDNMVARRDMFEKWCDTYSSDPDAIFIDGRLQAEQLQIFCVMGGDDATNRQHYEEEYLFDDNEVAEGSCTFKQTSHVAAMIAALMTSFFTNFIANIAEKNRARKVPFHFEYFIPLNRVTK